MAEKTLHDQLIDDLFDNAVSPREHAAKNEILILRAKLAEYERPQKRGKSEGKEDA